jgi:hypothetical protein
MKHLLPLLLLMSACAQPQPATSPSDWITLFDGTSTDAWKLYNSPDFPSEGWSIEDDALVFRKPVDATGWTSNKDIITKETFGDFELELEWSIAKGGNSGIFYFVLEQPGVEIYWSGAEMQVLDNENHPDATQGVDGNRKAGSLYDLIPAVPQNTKPFDEWNAVRIVSKGDVVQHWMNGEKVLEYTRFTPEWFAMLRKSKFRDQPSFAVMREGHIGLQDHGDVVKYRNIRVRRM